MASFATNLGTYSIMQAKLQGVLYGLQLAWNSGYRSVSLQMDSPCAVSSILATPPEDQCHSTCIGQIRELMTHDWYV
ncbi:hypothetical protein LINGRAHAP2_LOCUS23927 [Linum grandiflorum]